ANSSLGHNVILVDGQGQQYSEQHYGKIIKFEPAESFDLVISDGTKAYAPLLKHYLRWFVFIKPDLLVIFDDVQADQARKVEWLLHYQGGIEESESDLRVHNGGAGFDLNFLLPSRDQGWIATQIVRKTVYVNSNTGEIERPENRFVAFSTLHAYPEQQFLAVISLYEPQFRERSLWRSELVAVDQQSIRFKAQREAECLIVTLHVGKKETSIEHC
ncbi:MAG: heparinase II/III family protein, partial [bacterium]